MSNGNDDDGPVWNAGAIFNNNVVLAFVWTLAEWFAEHADDGATLEKMLADNPTLAHLRRRLYALADRGDPKAEGPILTDEDRPLLRMMARRLDYEIAMFLEESHGSS